MPVVDTQTIIMQKKVRFVSKSQAGKKRKECFSKKFKQTPQGKIMVLSLLLF